jgi:hypothetical protein
MNPGNNSPDGLMLIHKRLVFSDRYENSVTLRLFLEAAMEPSTELRIAKIDGAKVIKNGQSTQYLLATVCYLHTQNPMLITCAARLSPALPGELASAGRAQQIHKPL